MYQLDGSNTANKSGLGTTLRVMTGDTVYIYGKSFWHGSSPANSGHDLSVSDILTLLAGSGGIVNSGKGVTAGALTGSSVTPNDVTSWLTNAPSPGTHPKAYINWILFDDQFRVVGSNSGFSSIGSADQVTVHGISPVNISKNGYLYVYCSNESNTAVFFDNLQVIHKRGPLLEETHYYPFGLTMAGISSKAAGKLENRFKYNGIELDEDLGIDTYEAHFRNLNQQIGRWWQIDPKIENQESESPYSSMANNPILKSDPLGDEPCCSELWEGIKSAAVAVKNEAVNFWNGKGKVYEGVDWFNRTLNPLTDVYHAATGKDFVTGEKVSRMEAATGIVIAAVGGKVEAAVLKTAEKALVKYEVGTTDALLKKSVVGDGLDVHHVPQSQPAGQLISGYDKTTAPSISLSKAEHGAIPTLKGTNTAGSPRKQLAKDIFDLRKYTKAPNESLQKLIQLNKEMYPSMNKVKQN